VNDTDWSRGISIVGDENTHDAKQYNPTLLSPHRVELVIAVQIFENIAPWPRQIESCGLSNFATIR